MRTLILSFYPDRWDIKGLTIACSRFGELLVQSITSRFEYFCAKFDVVKGVACGLLLMLMLKMPYFILFYSYFIIYYMNLFLLNCFI